MLLSAPFYGVVSTELLFGWLANKYKRMKLQMMVGIGFLAISNILSPAIIQYTADLYFFAIRVFKGISMVFILYSYRLLQSFYV